MKAVETEFQSSMQNQQIISWLLESLKNREDWKMTGSCSPAPAEQYMMEYFTLWMLFLWKLKTIEDRWMLISFLFKKTTVVGRGSFKNNEKDFYFYEITKGQLKKRNTYSRWVMWWDDNDDFNILFVWKFELKILWEQQRTRPM